MKAKAIRFCILLFLGMVVALTSFSVMASKGDSVDAAHNKDACLNCHGPFEAKAKAPNTFITANGDKVNPHWYVPHDRQDAKSIPECTHCHKPHPLPLKSKDGLAKAGVDWCFSCHHSGDLKACNACH